MSAISTNRASYNRVPNIKLGSRTTNEEVQQKIEAAIRALAAYERHCSNPTQRQLLQDAHNALGIAQRRVKLARI